MREFELENVRIRRAAHAVMKELEGLGCRVKDHTLNRTRFDRYRPSDNTFRRDGYIGLYRPYGTRRLTVRVRLWPSVPIKLVIAAALLGGITLPTYLLLNVSASLWINTALVVIGLVATALLLHVTAREETRYTERVLRARLQRRLRPLVDEGDGDDPDEEDDASGTDADASAEDRTSATTGQGDRAADNASNPA